MNYQSTRGSSGEIGGCGAVARGIAADGGLYIPEEFPHITPEEIEILAGMDYIGRAKVILGMYFPEFSEVEMQALCEAAYGGDKFDCPEVAPTVKLNDETHVLELFHGPTCAFKDMALQMLPGLLTASLRKTGEERKVCILVATSGDTGKAALEGFRDVRGSEIVVFYPRDGVSQVQKLQMITQEGKNVHVCAVAGNFDDAQTGVKRVFADAEIAKKLDEKGIFLSSANSINWGRLAPQIVYYFSAYCDLLNEGVIKCGDPVNFCVPTGNFGNILAGFIASLMGLPVNRFICASNANDVLTDFIRTGTYDRNRTFKTTISPSMDILISSNVERLIYLLSDCNAACTAERMKALSETGKYTLSETEAAVLGEYFWGGCCDDEATKAAIRANFDAHGYTADTHTAVALSVLADYRRETGDDTHTVVVSTASPYKFCDSVLSAVRGGEYESTTALFAELKAATGVEIPAPLAGLDGKKVRFTDCIDRETLGGYVLQVL
ncbi:MAG: threonine synthase [Clostridia bacterium]|nr:threonine synthase [Clostridia bacterium]